MKTELQPTQKNSRIWQWLIFAMVIVLSFACVFFSAQGALMKKQERVINADMLADSRVSYHIDPKKDILFAPLDANIIAEATHDARSLANTPNVHDVNNTPVIVTKLPEQATPEPTKTPEKKTPTKTPRAIATEVIPSETTIPPTETPIPPTYTSIPATATSTATLKPTDTSTSPPPVPTKTPTEKPTKKPKKPTNTPIPPTATTSHQPTLTWTSETTSTFTPTSTPSPTPTNTSVSPLKNTPTPTLTNTSTPTHTHTPTFTPTDTPVPLPTDTPVPVYKNIRPLLTCVRDNGDGTFTAYFGYNNRNDYTVNISYGNRNRVIPGIIVPGQPTDFSPGQHHSVFSVDFQIAAMWILDGRIRVAGPDNNCP
jgi:hypothetical protein